MAGTPARVMAVVLLVAGVGGLGSPAPTRAAGTCLGEPVTIIGSEGSDRIVGTDGPDVISGEGGDDVIDGAGGDDRICGGAGDDTIEGGAGFDRCDGGAGADAVTCESVR